MWVFMSGCSRSGEITLVCSVPSALLHLETLLPPFLTCQKLLEHIEMGNVHSQFSQHASVSVTHLIPFLFLGRHLAACVYLIVL